MKVSKLRWFAYVLLLAVSLPSFAREASINQAVPEMADTSANVSPESNSRHYLGDPNISIDIGIDPNPYDYYLTPPGSILLGGSNDFSFSPRTAAIWDSAQGVGPIPLGEPESEITGVYSYAGNDYAVGWERNPVNTSLEPKIWVNGVKSDLPYSGIIALATGIYVNQNGVYVSGHRYTSPDALKVPVMWVNGVMSDLPLNFGFPNGYNYGDAVAIHGSGNDVYVVGLVEGYSNTGPGLAPEVVALWKNGERVAVGYRNVFSPTSIFIKDGAVYIAGNRPSYGTGHQGAIVLRNGLVSHLDTDNAWNKFTYAQSVYVDTYNRVFVAGYDFVCNACVNGLPNIVRAVLWKDTVPTYITDGTIAASATSVFVFDGDGKAYVGGYEFPGVNPSVPTHQQLDDFFQIAKLWSVDSASIVEDLGIDSDPSYPIQGGVVRSVFVKP